MNEELRQRIIERLHRGSGCHGGGHEAYVRHARAARRGYRGSPFIFLIRDMQTGAILLVGRVVNPG